MVNRVLRSTIPTGFMGIGKCPRICVHTITNARIVNAKHMCNVSSYLFVNDSWAQNTFVAPCLVMGNLTLKLLNPYKESLALIPISGSRCLT